MKCETLFFFFSQLRMNNGSYIICNDRPWLETSRRLFETIEWYTHHTMNGMSSFCSANTVLFPITAMHSNVPPKKKEENLSPLHQSHPKFTNLNLNIFNHIFRLSFCYQIVPILCSEEKWEWMAVPSMNNKSINGIKWKLIQ